MDGAPEVGGVPLVIIIGNFKLCAYSLVIPEKEPWSLSYCINDRTLL